jgi:hypothetical protein
MNSDKKLIVIIAVIVGVIAICVAVGKHQPAQTQTQTQIPRAMAAASCAFHLGAVGYVQEQEGDTINSQVNLKRFVDLDNQWSSNPEYKQYQKNIDSNVADAGQANLAKNIAQAGAGCDQLGIPRAQFKD